MIGLIQMVTAVTIISSEMAAHEEERKSDELARKTLTPEQYDKHRKNMDEFRAERSRKAEEERRHQDVCEAIRSTSFWRFGG